jgi:ubiquinone/menaquinone biosynthesis C-methylase UbiE
MNRAPDERPTPAPDTPSLPLQLVHALSRLPGAYQLQQQVAYPTTSRFRLFIARHVRPEHGERVLDLGCGTGNYRDILGQEYTGIDVNPGYIAAARGRHSGEFAVMDCSSLTFADDTFDHVVTIAATHHLNDEELDATLAGASRVCRRGGVIHVLDAVLPETGFTAFKHAWFRMDAGRFPRTRAALRAAVARHAELVAEDFLPGPLHDCAYLRARPHD